MFLIEVRFEMFVTITFNVVSLQGWLNLHQRLTISLEPRVLAIFNEAFSKYSDGIPDFKIGILGMLGNKLKKNTRSNTNQK